MGKYLVVLRMSSFQASFSRRKGKVHNNEEIEEYFLRRRKDNKSIINGEFLGLFVGIVQFFIFYLEQPPLSSFYLQYCSLFVIVLINFNIFFTVTFTAKNSCSCSSSSYLHSIVIRCVISSCSQVHFGICFRKICLLPKTLLVPFLVKAHFLILPFILSVSIRFSGFGIFFSAVLR